MCCCAAAGLTSSFRAGNRNYLPTAKGDASYFNPFVPILDHTDIGSFCESIDEYIQKGMLFSASELYLPVRMKPRGENSLSALKNNGVDHIELRMFDLNPKAPLGIDANDLKFAHLLMIYLLTLHDFDLTDELQKSAIADHQKAALIDTDEELVKRAENILEDMSEYYSDSKERLEIIGYESKKLHQSVEERYQNYYQSTGAAYS